LLAEGKIQTEPLITHRFGFSEADILKALRRLQLPPKQGPSKWRSAGDVLDEINSSLYHYDEVMLLLEQEPSRQAEQDCVIAT